jgi:putative transposase
MRQLPESVRHYLPSECGSYRTSAGQGPSTASSTPEQIIRKLREGERLLGEGADLVAVCKHLEISDQSWHRWRAQYGGLKSDDVKRLKELERENARLKKMVAEHALDIEMLKELNRPNW